MAAGHETSMLDMINDSICSHLHLKFYWNKMQSSHFGGEFKDWMLTYEDYEGGKEVAVQ